MTLSDIFALIDRHVRPLKMETTPLITALGRVSGRSLFAKRDAPPFDVSALDGYSVSGTGQRFRVRALLEPFDRVPHRLKQGEAFFVPTGGRFPAASRFVAREHVTEKPDEVVVETGADETKVVRKGDWMRRGTQLIGKGSPVTPGAMAALALAGHQVLKVHRKPAVAIITTGSELKNNRIVDSNRYLLAGLVQRDGGEVVSLHTADDTEEEISRVVKRLWSTDMVILTGGTSKGKRDVTKRAIERSRGRFHLESPPIVPGKTMAFGRKGGTCFYLLPGNPRAVAGLYELFVKRSLLRMAGRPYQDREYVMALPRKIEKPAGTIMAIPVRISPGSDAREIEELYPAEPNAFVVVEEHVGQIPKGTRVRVIRT